LVGPAQAVEERFPKLGPDGYGITSPRDDKYNCVAWIARDPHRWWEPGIDGCFWPIANIAADLDAGDLGEYLGVFQLLGFETCSDGLLDDGVEKIAIYAVGNDFQHVAYQRGDGGWSSKLGELNDVRHEQTTSLSGSGAFEYAPVLMYMSRCREPHPLADAGFLLP